MCSEARLHLRICGRTGCSVFFFNDTATTEIYTLSLHDALPISFEYLAERARTAMEADHVPEAIRLYTRSEEHTSELQSQSNLVCRLLLEKKNISKIFTSSCSSREAYPGHLHPSLCCPQHEITVG